ncbi:hypothetical protein BD311DRAFT_671661 [Dichomitus squalens]|uniref:Uncharacterized protein n=1 Tax=Dichomitus squalens TaxID=114155 RepID=A0A4Q9MB91_9APHY|nr:hypothetical protein BD311DRAFT_671661 [Dichomitus squalens]
MSTIHGRRHELPCESTGEQLAVYVRRANASVKRRMHGIKDTSRQANVTKGRTSMPRPSCAFITIVPHLLPRSDIWISRFYDSPRDSVLLVNKTKEEDASLNVATTNRSSQSDRERNAHVVGRLSCARFRIVRQEGWPRCVFQSELASVHSRAT